MEKAITLNAFELGKLKEFFHPRINQGQIFFSYDNVANFLISMGYKPNRNTKLDENGKKADEDFWYFDIPSEFRYATITKTETIHW